MKSKRKILGVLMVALKLTLKTLELQSKKKDLGVLIVVLKCTLDIVELQIQWKKKIIFLEDLAEDIKNICIIF